MFHINCVSVVIWHPTTHFIWISTIRRFNLFGCGNIDSRFILFTNHLNYLLYRLLWIWVSNILLSQNHLYNIMFNYALGHFLPTKIILIIRFSMRSFIYKWFAYIEIFGVFLFIFLIQWNEHDNTLNWIRFRSLSFILYTSMISKINCIFHWTVT